MVTATLSPPLDEPIYSGGSTISREVPEPYDVALQGRPFKLQLDPNAIEVFGQHYQRRSLQLVRDQADQSNEPGEQSVSPENFWRRSQQSWHKGAGQVWLDWPDADRNRFRSSKGIDPWTRKSLTLLNDTAVGRTSSNAGLRPAVAGTRLYLADGTALVFTADLSGYTTVTGTPASVLCQSVASDGFNVYAAFGASGVYSTHTSKSTATQFSTCNATVIGYVKGRLMAAFGPSIYNIVDTTTPDPLFTHPAQGWTWVGFAQAPGYIYAAGYAGGHSEIYAVTINDTGAELAAPTIAESLPEGEVIRAICGYQGFLLIGTDKGVRVAEVNTDGSLVLGGLISAPGPVRCFDPQGRFVWFGWTDYDTTSTGLGRLDLSVFTDPLVPAYASDLMATAHGVVSGTCLFGKQRVFVVDGTGVFAEMVGTPVASGTIDSGFVGYDIADPKQAVWLDLRHEPLPLGGSVTLSLAADSGDFQTAGISDGAGDTAPPSFYLGGRRGERFELRAVLTAGTGNPPAPQVTRYTLRADVTANPASVEVVPLVITDRLDVGDGDRYRSARGDEEYLRALCDSQAIFDYQDGRRNALVKMTAYQYVKNTRSSDVSGDFTGTFIATLRYITG